MTKKDFELIANAIGFHRRSELRGALALGTAQDKATQAKRDKYTHTIASMGFLAETIADGLEARYPRFNRERFIAACRRTDNT